MFDNVAHVLDRLSRGRRPLLVKTVGYRIISVVVTALVAYVLLRDVRAALDVGLWANLAKMGVYYAYEQAWAGTLPPG
jgi:uncharacterized membrane protein